MSEHHPYILAEIKNDNFFTFVADSNSSVFKAIYSRRKVP